MTKNICEDLTLILYNTDDIEVYYNKHLNTDGFNCFLYKNRYVFMVAKHKLNFNKLIIFDVKYADSHDYIYNIEISQILSQDFNDDCLRNIILYNLEVFSAFESFESKAC